MAVVVGACPEQIGVTAAKGRRRCVAGTQIDEADAAVTKEEIVGEVGIRLDEVELEELPQNQPQEQGCRPVPLRVRVLGAAQIFEGNAVQAVHREDRARGEILVDVRYDHLGLVGEECGVAAQVAGLGLVVGLVSKLTLGLLDQRPEVDLARKDPGHAQRCRQVVDVAVDAAGDTGVLDLERQLAPVDGRRGMNLPDRGRGDRLEVEAPEVALPARAPRLPKHGV